MWFSKIDKAARGTIGKTTFKAGGKEKFSSEVKDLQNEKKKRKISISKASTASEKKVLIAKHKEIQNRVTSQIEEERSLVIKGKFEKIIADKTRITFWNEKKTTLTRPYP